MDRFWDKVKKTDGCWHWIGYRNKDNSGKGYQLPYGRFKFEGKLHLAHRVAWILTYGPIPDGAQVAHRCDVVYCVRPDHLFLTTQAGNNADKAAKGRAPKGEDAGRAKLTETDVQAIRRIYADQGSGITGKTGTVSYASLARNYSVSKAAIDAVVTYKSWKHLS